MIPLSTACRGSRRAIQTAVTEKSPRTICHRCAVPRWRLPRRCRHLRPRCIAHRPSGSPNAGRESDHSHCFLFAPPSSRPKKKQWLWSFPWCQA
eukprot:944763-Pyramimonas_sp.AAC.1